MMPVEMHVYASMAKIISMLISIQMLPYIAAKLAQELKWFTSLERKKKKKRQAISITVWEGLE